MLGNIRSLGVAALSFAVLSLLLFMGCSRKDDGPAGPGSIRLSGRLGTGYIASVRSHEDRWFCKLRSSSPLLASINLPVFPSPKPRPVTFVDKILAVQTDRGRLAAFSMAYSKSASVNPDGTFSISIEKDMDWILVLMDTTASLENRFVGYVDLSAGGANSLLLLPATQVTTDSLDLGDVTQSGDTAVATNPITEAQLSMTASQLADLAKNDDAFKSVKNLVLNYDSATGVCYTLRPDFHWKGDYAAIQNAFPDLTATPDFYANSAFSFQMDTNSTEVTIQQVAGDGVARVPIELFPPSTVNSSPLVRTYNDTTPISNNNATANPPAVDGSIEVRDDDFYATNRYGDISYGFDAQLDAIPAGYWLYKVGGSLRAQYDVAVAKPMDPSGKPLGMTPVIRVNVEAGTNRITSIDIKWYYLDAGAYVPVTDISTLKHLIGTGGIFLDNRATGSAYESMNIDPSVDTNVVPPSTWYYSAKTGSGYLAEGIGIFYQSSGIGFFFHFLKP